MAATRADVVAEALSWEATPYHAAGRLKGIGTDCAVLPLLTYIAVGILPDVAPEYSSP